MTFDPWEQGGVSTNQERLECFAVFCLMVAGKRADQTASKLDAFLRDRNPGESPLAYVERLHNEGALRAALEKHKTGQYGRLALGLPALAAQRDRLMDLTIEDLETIRGVGPKTSRFFLAYSRPNVRTAILDTHVLSWMRRAGVPNVPRQTPQSPKQYARLEREYLRLCDEMGRDPIDLDTDIWTASARRAA